MQLPSIYRFHITLSSASISQTSTCADRVFGRFVSEREPDRGATRFQRSLKPCSAQPVPDRPTRTASTALSIIQRHHAWRGNWRTTSEPPPCQQGQNAL